MIGNPLPPRKGLATVEVIAVNAIMAGCRPEYMPVLIAAVEGLTDPKFPLELMQVTTNPMTPFLLVNAEKDLPLLPEMSREMRATLERNGCVCEHRTIENRNHNSVLFKAADPSDPVARAIVEFIRK